MWRRLLHRYREKSFLLKCRSPIKKYVRQKTGSNCFMKQDHSGKVSTGRSWKTATKSPGSCSPSCEQPESMSKNKCKLPIAHCSLLIEFYIFAPRGISSVGQSAAFAMQRSGVRLPYTPPGALRAQ